MEGGGGTDGGESFGGESFGGDTGYGGSDSFGDSSGFTGSEGATLGGLGVGGEVGDFGGGLSGFGDLGSMLASLDFAESNPFGFDANPFGLDFADMNFTESPFASLEGMFSQSQNPLDNLPKGLKGLLGFLAKSADKTGMLGKGLGMYGMMNNPDQGKAWGSSLGGLAGSMLGGPLGGFVGASLGGNLGAGTFSGLTGQAGANPSAEGNTSMGGVGGMLEGLGGIYAGYKGMKDSGKMLGSLQSLYNQNSPYAQQLRQQLQRQDAAGGRRSQYGPREVELQARLAQMASSQIPAMSQLSRQQQIARNSMLQQGIGAFNSMGGLSGLKDLFGFGGSGGLYDTAASGLINSGSLGNLFSLDPFQNSPVLPDFDFDPFGGP